MRKILVFALLLLLTVGCGTKEFNGNLTGSDYKGNYVYGAAMNLAWEALSNDVLGEDVVLKTDDEDALDYVKKFNDASFSKTDLDEESYYVKSGYGQETVNTINNECRDKFPDKSFDDLQLNLTNHDIISYAYFLKAVEYPIAFERDPYGMLFDGKRVEGFYSDGDDQDKNIEIIKYWNNDKFIIALKLKDESDELILAKGFDMNDPEGIVYEVNALKNESREILTEGESFSMPNLHLDYKRNYNELIGKTFANEGFEDYAIGEMYEKIKFDMDNKGARAENESAIIVEEALIAYKEMRRFILDEPFWVIMKRAKSESPYFILGVNNTELMELL